MRSLYVDYGGYMFRNLLRTLLSLLFLLFFLLEHIGNLLLTCYFLRPSERIFKFCPKYMTEILKNLSESFLAETLVINPIDIFYNILLLLF